MSTGTDASVLGGRVELTSLTAAVAAVDVLLVLAFVLLGEVSHYGATATALMRAPGTAVPFLLGWAVVAPFAGVYTAAARRSVRGAVSRTLAAWVGTVVVAQSLRATDAFPGDFAVPFALVSLGVGLALLIPWRALVARRMPAGA